MSDYIKILELSNDMSGFGKNQLDLYNNASDSEKIALNGIACDKKYEPIPVYFKAPCEDIVAIGQNNAQIVTGRDRPSNILSGYGGRGDTKCGSIDIVVGRSIPEDGVVDKKTSEINYVNPDFAKDAARIHISQKTDIDVNFNLAKGSVGNSLGRSGIGIKADSVRIIGTEGIKLVTRDRDRNSLDGYLGSIKGIDLIAGNKDRDLQPLVKGDDLVKFLKLVQQDIISIVNMINSLVMNQMQLNAGLAAHMHDVIPDPTSPTLIGTLPSKTLALATMSNSLSLMIKDIPSHGFQIMNTTASEIDYLNNDGSKYILSKYNNTN